MPFGFIILALLRCSYCLITRSYNPATKFAVAAILVAALNAMIFVPRMGLPGAQGEAIGLAAMGVIVLAAILTELIKPSVNTTPRIAFDCPYCEKAVSFETNRQDDSAACPECAEIVTVTSDASVHARDKEEYLALLQEAAAADASEFDVENAQAVRAGGYRDPILENGL